MSYFSLFSYALLASVAVSASSVAQPLSFKCPAEGVIVTGTLGSTKYHGAEPNDPAACKMTTVRGTEAVFIYGRYAAGILSSDARAALDRFFSGQEKSVTIKFRSGNNNQDYINTWTMVGWESGEVAGRKFNSAKLEYEEKIVSGSYHGRWTYWLEPKLGLWLAGVYTHIGGTVSNNTRDFMMQSITLP